MYKLIAGGREQESASSFEVLNPFDSALIDTVASAEPQHVEEALAAAEEALGRIQERLEALRDEHTLSELAARYEIHPNVITNWKKRAREGLVDVFAGKVEKRQSGSEAKTKELYAKIGELTVEKDFLSKVLDR